MIRSLIIFVIISSLFFLFSSCQDEAMPKPRGYFRIDLPKKDYVVLDTIFPFRFERQSFTKIEAEKLQPEGEFWFNIVYPKQNARIYCSYKPVEGSIDPYIEDARTFAMKHISKASGINQSIFENPTQQVYGVDYSINGMSTASPYQFYLTDSVNHFFRGSLYFNLHPNNDSMAPVIEYIRDDIRHMIDSFEWKNIDL